MWDLTPNQQFHFSAIAVQHVYRRGSYGKVEQNYNLAQFQASFIAHSNLQNGLGMRLEHGLCSSQSETTVR